MTFTWITVLTLGLAGFFGAGTVSLWRSDHRFGAGVIAALALVCLAFAIISVIPGPADS
jgi:hypothetical protein